VEYLKTRLKNSIKVTIKHSFRQLSRHPYYPHSSQQQLFRSISATHYGSLITFTLHSGMSKLTQIQSIYLVWNVHEFLIAIWNWLWFFWFQKFYSETTTPDKKTFICIHIQCCYSLSMKQSTYQQLTKSGHQELPKKPRNLVDTHFSFPANTDPAHLLLILWLRCITNVIILSTIISVMTTGMTMITNNQCNVA